MNPTPRAGILNNGMFGIFLRRNLINWFPLPFQDLTSISASETLGEHRCVGTDGNVADGEEVVLGVVVGLEADGAGRHED
jgi:hypothetical protein